MIAFGPFVLPLSVALRTKFTHCFACLPDFALAHFFKFCVEFLTIIRLAVRIYRDLSLVSCLHAFIKFIEYRESRIAELLPPIKRTTLSSSGAVCLHPVHTVLRNERHEALREFLNSLVECLRWSVTILTKHLILSRKDTLDSTHESTTLTCKI